MTNKLIGKYKDLGWEFSEDQSVSHHNGDIDDELWVKSPRLEDRFCIESSRHSVPKWEDVKEEDMLKRENYLYACQTWGKIQSKVEALVIKALEAGQEKIVLNLKRITDDKN
jgi:hypothetical protein